MGNALQWQWEWEAGNGKMGNDRQYKRGAVFCMPTSCCMATSCWQASGTDGLEEMRRTLNGTSYWSLGRPEQTWADGGGG